MPTARSIRACLFSILPPVREAHAPRELRNPSSTNQQIATPATGEKIRPNVLIEHDGGLY